MGAGKGIFPTINAIVIATFVKLIQGGVVMVLSVGVTVTTNPVYGKLAGSFNFLTINMIMMLFLKQQLLLQK